MGNYITVDDVVAEGAPRSNTSRIELRIAKWEAIVEELTRNVFRLLEPGEQTFDGSNTSILHFTLPLIEVTALKINGDTTELSTEYYRAYTGISQPQDDRRNPKIELIESSTSIFTRFDGKFLRGYDQKVTAKWGFVDEDPDTPGSYVTPPVIKACLTQLVTMDLDGYFDAQEFGIAGRPVSPIRRERTDGHEVEYQMTENVKMSFAAIPRDIADVLMLYRAPIMGGVVDARKFSAVSGVRIW
jgi:hypothetical protein